MPIVVLDQQATVSSTTTAGNCEEPLDSIDSRLPVPDPGSVSHDSVSNETQSPLANSWKGYRMIDVGSETSVDSLAVAQWGLSQEAERDLLVHENLLAFSVPNTKYSSQITCVL